MDMLIILFDGIGVILFIYGIWIIFFAKIKTSTVLLRYPSFNLLAALLGNFNKQSDYFIKWWVKSLIGLFFIFSSLMLFYLVWLSSH